MKSMEDYINEVYQKYEESERNHEVYKTVKVKYHSPLTTLCSITACLLLVCVCIVGVNKFTKEPEQNYVSSEINNNGAVIYTQYLNVDSKFETRIENLINDSDIIGIASEINLNNYSCEIKKEQVILKTNGKIKMSNILKGNNNFVNEEIHYSKKGGILSLVDIEKDKNLNWEEWELLSMGKVIPENQKTTTYYKQIPQKYCEIEDGKQYLIFLDYNEEKNIYEVSDFAYGIMEYDPATNMVKNIDTGEFEEFDWNLITQE